MSDVGGRALIIYGCLDNHYECRNSHYFKEYLFNLHGVEDYSSLDNKAVAGSFEKATRIVFDFFNEDLYDDKRRFNDDFQNSKFRKLVDISTDYFMGSIMCNYYKMISIVMTEKKAGALKYMIHYHILIQKKSI